jgi:hypothetical protein
MMPSYSLNLTMGIQSATRDGAATPSVDGPWRDVLTRQKSISSEDHPVILSIRRRGDVLILVNFVCRATTLLN